MSYIKQIIAKPVFVLEVTKPLMKVLLRLSEHHYDATCRSASNVARTSSVGFTVNGFLTIWNNQFCCEEVATVNAELGTLDLSLKICENGALLCEPGEWPLVMQYVTDVIFALRSANQLLGNWKALPREFPDMDFYAEPQKV